MIEGLNQAVEAFSHRAHPEDNFTPLILKVQGG
jgi:hypothetical protein